MAKSSRKPVLAAGGIVIRNGTQPLFAVVQRRRDDAWVLPKGKLKANERPIAAARREAREETGSDVRVHEFLGVISYRNGSGPKLAHFWRMQAIGSASRKLMDDIKAVEWLPLKAAIERLSLTREHTFLRSVGHKALRRTRRRARPKSRHELAEDVRNEIAPLAVEHAPPLVKVPSPPVTPAAIIGKSPALVDGAGLLVAGDAAAPRAKRAKPPQRWHALARLRKRLDAAIGRGQRRA
jgi:8-oxo-dGTP diphosphatase